MVIPGEAPVCLWAPLIAGRPGPRAAGGQGEPVSWRLLAEIYGLLKSQPPRGRARLRTRLHSRSRELEVASFPSTGSALRLPTHVLPPCTWAACPGGAPGLGVGARAGQSGASGLRDTPQIIKSWRSSLSIKTKQLGLFRPSGPHSDGNLIR